MQPNPPKLLESEVPEVAMRRNAEENNTMRKSDRTNINRADERMQLRRIGNENGCSWYVAEYHAMYK
jgi:hypothetical protein